MERKTEDQNLKSSLTKEVSEKRVDDSTWRVDSMCFKDTELVVVAVVIVIVVLGGMKKYLKAAMRNTDLPSRSSSVSGV